MSMRLISDHNAQLNAAKWAFVTRRVSRDDVRGFSQDFAKAKSGDLVLGRVASIGQHKGLQLTTGRRSILYPGDIVVMCCGARYAPDQFEGVAEIDPDGADVLAAGGCLGRKTMSHDGMKTPTRVKPMGVLVDRKGDAVNVAQYALPSVGEAPDVPVIAVFGASMNAGKTTAATAVVRGLQRAGWSVAALKGTGTGAFGDFNAFLDANPHYVADMVDAGMVSTFLQPLERVKQGVRDLLGAAAASGANFVVLEIADGLFQKETAALLADETFRSWISGSIFACGDPLSAAGGVAALARFDVAPLAITGVVSCSPMSSAETHEATGVTVLTKSDLSDPAEASALANAMNRASTQAA